MIGENVNMSKLLVRETREFLGRKIPVVLGCGFDGCEKGILAKDIAEIHDMKVFHVNELIKRNVKHFKDGVDVIDLKSSYASEALLNLGFSLMQISKAKNIYVLSERGYAKLIKAMDSELAWEVHDQLMDSYTNKKELTYKEQLILKLALEGITEEEAQAFMVLLKNRS